MKPLRLASRLAVFLGLAFAWAPSIGQAQLVGFESAKLLPPDGEMDDRFGRSVALSSTGDTAIVGANGDDIAGGTNVGSAYVFTRNATTGVWKQQEQLLAYLHAQVSRMAL